MALCVSLLHCILCYLVGAVSVFRLGVACEFEFDFGLEVEVSKVIPLAAFPVCLTMLDRGAWRVCTYMICNGNIVPGQLTSESTEELRC